MKNSSRCPICGHVSDPDITCDTCRLSPEVMSAVADYGGKHRFWVQCEDPWKLIDWIRCSRWVGNPERHRTKLIQIGALAVEVSLPYIEDEYKRALCEATFQLLYAYTEREAKIEACLEAADNPDLLGVAYSAVHICRCKCGASPEMCLLSTWRSANSLGVSPRVMSDIIRGYFPEPPLLLDGYGAPKVRTLLCTQCLTEVEVPVRTKEENFVCNLCREEGEIQEAAAKEELRNSLECLDEEA